MPATLGILSLETAFPRILGDAGSPASYPFEVKVAIVEGADSAGVVIDGLPSKDIVDRMEVAARNLEAAGVDAIISTCGFLITVQERIARLVKPPVMLSALSLVPMVQRTNPGPIGILTASSSALGQDALRAAAIDPREVVVEGLQGEAIFARTFLVPYAQQPHQFDRSDMERAVVAAAKRLIEKAPDIGAIVLECGNLPPYADAIRATAQRPVFHLVDAATFLIASGRR